MLSLGAGTRGGPASSVASGVNGCQVSLDEKQQDLQPGPGGLLPRARDPVQGMVGPAASSQGLTQDRATWQTAWARGGAGAAKGDMGPFPKAEGVLTKQDTGKGGRGES